MGKLKSHLQDWLDKYGHKLGYDMSNAPEFEDMDWVVNDNVDAQSYWETKKEGDK